MINFDPSRLQHLLLNTGLQNKDNALYQVIKQIIDALTRAVSGINDNSIIVQNNSTTNTTSNIQSTPTQMGETIIIEENYYMTNGSTSTSIATYDSVLTNGDPVSPEIIFDSFGDVVMVTGIPL